MNIKKIIKDVIKRSNPIVFMLQQVLQLTNNPLNFFCVLQFLGIPLQMLIITWKDIVMHVNSLKMLRKKKKKKKSN